MAAALVEIAGAHKPTNNILFTNLTLTGMTKKGDSGGNADEETVTAEFDLD